METNHFIGLEVMNIRLCIHIPGSSEEILCARGVTLNYRELILLKFTVCADVSVGSNLGHLIYMAHEIESKNKRRQRREMRLLKKNRWIL